MNRIERSFNLPADADADTVAETIRAIIAGSVATESLKLETDPNPKIDAVVYMPDVPEEGTTLSTLWDAFVNIELQEIEEKEFSRERLSKVASAIFTLNSNGKRAMAILTKSVQEFFDWLGIDTCQRLFDIPVYETHKFGEETAVVLGSPSRSNGPIDSDTGIILRFWE